MAPSALSMLSSIFSQSLPSLAPLGVMLNAMSVLSPPFSVVLPGVAFTVQLSGLEFTFTFRPVRVRLPGLLTFSLPW